MTNKIEELIAFSACLSTEITNLEKVAAEIQEALDAKLNTTEVETVDAYMKFDLLSDELAQKLQDDK